MAAVQALHTIENLDPPGRILLRKIIDATGQTDLEAITELTLELPLAFIHPIFNRLVNLISLTLNNGHIQKIENLSNLTKLRQLNLANNRIFAIENLQHFPDLEILNLDFNPVQVLEPEAFARNPRLHTLSLRVSCIGNLQRTVTALQRMTSLRRVSLQVHQVARHSPVTVSDARSVETPSPTLARVRPAQPQGAGALAAAIAAAMNPVARRPEAAGTNPTRMDLRRFAIAAAAAAVSNVRAGRRDGTAVEQQPLFASQGEPGSRRRNRSGFSTLATAAAPAAPAAAATADDSDSDWSDEEDEIEESAPRRVRAGDSSSPLMRLLGLRRYLDGTGSLPAAEPVPVDVDEDSEEDDSDSASDTMDGGADTMHATVAHSFVEMGDDVDMEDAESDEPDEELVDMDARAAAAASAENSDSDSSDSSGIADVDQEALRMSRSPVCLEPHYRALVIHTAPHIVKLDGLTITEEERRLAPERIAMYIEPFAYGFNHRPDMFRVLREREAGLRSVTSRSHSPSLTMRDSPPVTRRAFLSSRLSTVKRPVMETLALGNEHCMARQFEYSPTVPEWMAVGTTTGEIVIVNPRNSKRVAAVKSGGNIVLGLCWLRTAPSRFLAGCENGCIEMLDVNEMRSSGKRALLKFDEFPHLTCVHANCTDQFALASGYSGSIKLYDLPTGKTVENLENIHQQHINVLKFANHNPNIFCTSSFDRTIKLWDLRSRRHCVFERQCNAGCVMMCFSPDDRYVLSASVDNEVRQFLLDGSPVLRYELKQLQSNTNYTRAYFMNGSEYIIVGSCEESSVKVCETATGRILSEIEFAGGKYGPSTSLSAPYIQSLRADPFGDFQCSVVLGYNSTYYQAQLVRVNLLQDEGTAG